VTSAGLTRGFAALRVRNYRLYWSGQILSQVGTWMQQVSLPWLVLALGGSPLQLGIVAALRFLPATVLAPFGGVFVDRIDKQRALIATQIALMVVDGILFGLTVAGVVQIPMVMALAFGLGLVNAIDMPLRQSLAADLVPRNILANAIALNSMAFNGARVVGPAVAGVIIALGTALLGGATSGVAINLGVNTISYLAVVVNLARMDPAQIRRAPRPEQHPPVLLSLKEGVAYAARTPIVLWALVLLAGVASFGFNFQILLPLFSKDVLHLGAEGYGALYAAMGVGSLAGAMTLAFMQNRSALRLILGGGLAFGVLEIGLGLTRVVWLAFPLILLVGYFSMLMINTINAMVQANVSDQLRGRVMALYVTVFAGSAPVGGLFAGIVAEKWGTPPAFVIGALLSLATVGLVAWRLRAARTAGKLGTTIIDSGVRVPEQPDPSAVQRLER